ncbi:MAG: hypothetical protein QOH09_3085 [Pseudonocardiales bacterium]|jgi:hypothetical protein|nr:hypothetical protein [Pseudonocardiales bacterium]
MNDDVYCVFILIACMVALAVPSSGQVIVAVFAFALAIAARVASAADHHGDHPHHTRHDVGGR